MLIGSFAIGGGEQNSVSPDSVEMVGSKVIHLYCSQLKLAYHNWVLRHRHLFSFSVCRHFLRRTSRSRNCHWRRHHQSARGVEASAFSPVFSFPTFPSVWCSSSVGRNSNSSSCFSHTRTNILSADHKPLITNPHLMRNRNPTNPWLMETKVGRRLLIRKIRGTSSFRSEIWDVNIEQSTSIHKLTSFYFECVNGAKKTTSLVLVSS